MTEVTKRVLLVAVGDDGVLRPLKVDPVTGYLHTDAVINVASLTVSSDVSDRPARLLGHVTVDSMPEVEIKNDAGSPVPVSGTVSITGAPTVNIGTIPEVEIKNDTGNPVPVSTVDLRTYQERMLAKAPANGYVLYLDVTSTNAGYIYIAEALAGATTGNNWRGVRIALDANGNPLGAVGYNGAFDWADRASVTWTV